MPLNERIADFNASVSDFNARVTRHQVDLERFNREVSRYNLMMAYSDGLDESSTMQAAQVWHSPVSYPNTPAFH